MVGGRGILGREAQDSDNPVDLPIKDDLVSPSAIGLPSLQRHSMAPAPRQRIAGQMLEDVE